MDLNAVFITARTKDTTLAVLSKSFFEKVLPKPRKPPNHTSLRFGEREYPALSRRAKSGQCVKLAMKRVNSPHLERPIGGIDWICHRNNQC